MKRVENRQRGDNGMPIRDKFYEAYSEALRSEIFFGSEYSAV